MSSPTALASEISAQQCLVCLHIPFRGNNRQRVQIHDLEKSTNAGCLGCKFCWKALNCLPAEARSLLGDEFDISAGGGVFNIKSCLNVPEFRIHRLAGK
jgi:hypothetical protein